VIPASHISFNDDGTAWWVIDTTTTPDYEWALDRPCDTCDEVSPWLTNIVPCKDCDGAGRHTFDIVVADRLLPHLPFATYRVSVIPGTVLPIRQQQGLQCEYVGQWIARVGDRWLIQECDGVNLTTHPALITLPPAAAPGLWAVKLKVAQ
jgi:hypothetical protein